MTQKRYKQCKDNLQNMNLRENRSLKWAILVSIAFLEFFVIYWNDIPTGTSVSIVPLKLLISNNNSLFVDGAIENNFNLLFTPFLFFGQVVHEVMYLSLTFVIAVLSISYSIEYFYKTYFYEIKISKTEIFLVQLITSLCFTMSYYFSGGQFFSYGIFIAFLPFALTIFDRTISTNYHTSYWSLLKNSIILGATASFLVVDTRTLVYTILIIIAWTPSLLNKNIEIMNLKLKVR